MSVNIDLAERMKVIAARINSGQDTYAGRLDAWHSLGSVSGKFQTLEEIAIAAHADFPVVKLQLEFQGKPVDSYGTFRTDQEIPKGVTPTTQVQLEDGSVYYLTFLGNVGKDYGVIQTTSLGTVLDRLVGQVDGAHYETMGTLDFGRVVFAQVNPNFSIRIGEDVSDIYLSFRTSHDGSLAACVYETATRQVCKNTLRIGYLKRLSATLRVRHTANAEKRIANLSTEIEEIRNVAMTMQERLTYLSTRRVKKENLVTIMNRLFPPTKDEETGIEESSPRRDNILAEVLALYDNNDNNTFPEQRGTGYNLLNAVTNYVDHSRSSKGDGRAVSAVFGSGDRLKSQALEIILEEAERMPTQIARGGGEEVDWASMGFKAPVVAN